MSFTYHFQVDATLVSNEFIDRYLAEANGEYVKVYLYLLRHRGEPVSLERIAEGLNHTEADIRRAIAYWEKLGVLSTGTAFASARQTHGGRHRADEAGTGGKDRRLLYSRPTAGSLWRQVAAPEPAKGARPVYSQDQVNRLQGDGEFSELLYIAQRYLNKIFTQRELEVFAYLYDGAPHVGRAAGICWWSTVCRAGTPASVI